jgi:hypothetical protein
VLKIIERGVEFLSTVGRFVLGDGFTDIGDGGGEKGFDSKARDE